MPVQRTRDNQSQSARSLDVTSTDTPSPSLPIATPKPLAFAYPEQHNLNGSPSSSRSCSPEPDAVQFTDPFSQFSMVSIPTHHPHPFPSSERGASPAPSMKRRKSSAASSPVDEHRPKKGDPDYIKRPENAFIHFRRHCVAELQKELEASGADATVKKKRQADLSKEISKRWRELSAEEGQVWKDMAAQSKKDHLEKYPNYVYRPQRNKEKERAKKMSLSASGPSSSSSSAPSKRQGRQGEEPTISFVVPLPAPRGPRRPSAPTPPPYQSITIPQVVHRLHEPESPSDSLVHCISRVSTSNSVAGNMFDFIPQNAYVAPPFLGSVPQIQPMQVENGQNDFMRNLFQAPPPPQNRIHGPSPLERLAMEMDVSSASSPSAWSQASSSRGPLSSLSLKTSHPLSSTSSSPASPMGPVTPPSFEHHGSFGGSFDGSNAQGSFDGAQSFDGNNNGQSFDSNSNPQSFNNNDANNTNDPSNPNTNTNWSFTMPEPFELQFPETEADLALKELEANPSMYAMGGLPSFGMGGMEGMKGFGMGSDMDNFSMEGLKGFGMEGFSMDALKDGANLNNYSPPLQWTWPTSSDDQCAILEMDNNWDVDSVPSVLMGEEALAAMSSGTKFPGDGANGSGSGSTRDEADKGGSDGGEGIHFNEFNQSLPRIGFGVAAA